MSGFSPSVIGAVSGREGIRGDAAYRRVLIEQGAVAAAADELSAIGNLTNNEPSE